MNNLDKMKMADAAELKANKFYPNVSFEEDVESQDTFRTNEIKLSQRMAFIDGYKDGYNDAVKTIASQAININQLYMEPYFDENAISTAVTTFHVVDQNGVMHYTGTRKGCEYFIQHCWQVTTTYGITDGAGQ